MKKWLYPIIAGGLVMALGVTFSRSVHSHRSAVAAEQATTNEAQVAAGKNLATETADPDALSDAKSGAAESAKSVNTNDAAPAVAENAGADAATDQPQIILSYGNTPWSVVLKDFADATKTELVVVGSMPFSRFTKSDLKPLSRADALEVLNQAMEPENFRLQIKGNQLILTHLKDATSDARQGTVQSRPSPRTIDESPKILIVPVQNRDAASLLELIREMFPKFAGIHADPRTNSLIFPSGVSPDVLEIVRAIDQPETKTKNNGLVAAADTPNPLTDLPIVGRLFATNQAPSGGPPSPAAREYQQFEAQCLALAAACREQKAAVPQDAKRFEQLKNELQGAVHSAFHARQSWQRAQAAQLRERLEQIERRISERSQISNEIIQRRVDELLNPQQQWEPATDEAAEISAAASPDNKNAMEQKCWETLGLKLARSNASQLKPFHNRYRGGFQIIGVRHKGIATRSGIKKGDILVGLGDWETIRWEDVKYILNQTRLFSGSDPLKFYVIRGNEVLYGHMKFAAGNAPAGSSNGDRELPAKLMTVDSNVDGRPLEGSTDAGSDPARDATQRPVRQSVGDPRQELLNAEAAVDAARAALVNAKAVFKWAESISKESQDLLSKGQVKESDARASANVADARKAELQRAEKVLEIAERRLSSSRETLALEIKFLEHDLADAKARMDHAAAELARFEELYKQKAISQDVYEAKKLPQQLAASQYQRAKMLLDLYQRAEPDKNPPPDVPQPAGSLNNQTNSGGAVRPPKLVEIDLSANGDDPRQRVRDAVHAITAARAPIVAAEADVAANELQLKRLQEANSRAAGSVPQHLVSNAEQSLAKARAALQSKRVDLDIKEQQLEEARESLVGRVKLLEIDLADAILRLEHSESDLSRAAQLLKSAAISREEYETKRLAQQLAKLQCERAQTVLDLYRKALPGQGAATEKGQSGSNQKPSDGAPQAGDRSSGKPQD